MRRTWRRPRPCSATAEEPAALEVRPRHHGLQGGDAPLPHLPWSVSRCPTRARVGIMAAETPRSASRNSNPAVPVIGDDDRENMLRIQHMVLPPKAFAVVSLSGKRSAKTGRSRPGACWSRPAQHRGAHELSRSSWRRDQPDGARSSMSARHRGWAAVNRAGVCDALKREHLQRPGRLLYAPSGPVQGPAPGPVDEGIH